MKRDRERKRRERGGKCEPSRYTKAEKTMLHRSLPPRSFETRVESERRLTGTESHQSRRAGLRGVEHAETQTDGARGGRRRRAHALGRARRAAGHVPESSAHGRAEKNVSVIRGVEITHCVRSRRGIRAIVSRSRLRLVGVDPRARSTDVHRGLPLDRHNRPRRRRRAMGVVGGVPAHPVIDRAPSLSRVGACARGGEARARETRRRARTPPIAGFRLANGRAR